LTFSYDRNFKVIKFLSSFSRPSQNEGVNIRKYFAAKREFDGKIFGAACGYSKFQALLTEAFFDLRSFSGAGSVGEVSEFQGSSVSVFQSFRVPAFQRFNVSV